ncbi:hypothetical protein SAMN04487886_10692 [Clostridium sp. DSM 8431]|uniref:hypothetical protein n=1 Tax=Clostridium sp. DSM 8431 TaxID=1761781 RepID=UPI0008E1932D|nr:hypothetical protein [Clostridium sp. DSM 8431]SFU59360.1 hypothetical protein SAMN04487886_10692 [Clostridium sp. DSM 8431]
MNSKFKFASILLVPFTLAALTACGSSSSKDDGKKAAEAYVGAYLNKDVNYDEGVVSKEAIEELVLKRDYKAVQEYNMNGNKDKEILGAYYEALKNVEYTVKSASENKDEVKATVSIKGVDVSGISEDVMTYRVKIRREQKLSKEELNSKVEERAVEDLKSAQSKDETDVELSFTKDSDGKLKLSDDSIGRLENTISYFNENYSNHTGDVPEEFKEIEKTK